MWSAPTYEAVARIVQARTGLIFNPEMVPTVESKIRRAMQERRIVEISRYIAMLEADPVFDGALVDQLTIGETYFFREPAQLDFIRTEVIPTLADGRGRPLRAWSAGCASGEEAYTLAIILREAGVAGGATIIGTDISHGRIAQAREALFSRWSLRGVPEPVVREYFQRQGSRYRLVPAVRSAVKFRPFNLLEENYASTAVGIWGMDLILCRNVLIYLSPRAVAEVAARLMGALNEDGWLVLGASDPPLADLVPCEVVVTGAGVAYRRPRKAEQGTQTVPSTVTLPPLGAVVGEVESEVQVREAAVPSSAPTIESPDTDTLAEVEVRFLARDYAAAAELAAEAVRSGVDDRRLWVLRIRALAKQGEFEMAGRVCSAALEAHRTSAELMCLHAVLLSAAGHEGEAAAAARRALYLEKEMIMAHLVLGHALRRSKEPLKARRALENAERLLLRIPPETIVPASDGEPAARLLELVRRELRLASAA